MINIYDIAYAIGVGATAPIWLARGRLRRKVFKAFGERTGHDLALRKADGPAVMVHAVSLGEINAIRAMIRLLVEARGDLHVIISTTTDTGFARAKELYGTNPRVTLIRYPLDFTRAIERVLSALRPDVVVLMELEVWPNFVRQCQKREIPVLLVNGRLTHRSFRHYRWGGALARRTFRRLSAIRAQEQAYAGRFIALGAPAERVRVTGTMKFDTAQIADQIDEADQLAAELGLRPGKELIWVCGSTGPGEEEILLEIYRRMIGPWPTLRLVLVPRKPERFDDVEELIRGSTMNVIRRSEPPSADDREALRDYCIPAVILGDTMGDLRKFYSLADVVFVGRTLVDLGPRQHGSDMIEPAALAKPVVVGPYTGNFAEVMQCFRSTDAIREVATAEDLERAIEQLLRNSAAAIQMGRRAQGVVRQQQGATARHVELILECLPTHPRRGSTSNPMRSE